VTYAFEALATDAGLHLPLRETVEQFLAALDGAVRLPPPVNPLDAAWATIWFMDLANRGKLNDSALAQINSLAAHDLAFLESISGFVFTDEDARKNAAKRWLGALLIPPTPESSPEKAPRAPTRQQYVIERSPPGAVRRELLPARSFGGGPQPLPAETRSSLLIEHSYTSDEKKIGKPTTHVMADHDAYPEEYLAAVTSKSKQTYFSPSVKFTLASIDVSSGYGWVGISISRGSMFAIAQEETLTNRNAFKKSNKERIKVQTLMQTAASEEKWLKVAAQAGGAYAWLLERLTLRILILQGYALSVGDQVHLDQCIAQRDTVPAFIAALTESIRAHALSKFGAGSDGFDIEIGKAIWEVWQTGFLNSVSAIKAAATLLESSTKRRRRRSRSSSPDETSVSVPRSSDTRPAKKPQTLSALEVSAEQRILDQKRRMFQPLTRDVIGKKGIKLAEELPPRFRCQKCKDVVHFTWECPRGFAKTFGEAWPGFTFVGKKIPSAFSTSGRPTPETAAAWKSYINRHDLKVQKFYRNLEYQPDFGSDSVAPKGEVTLQR
jgi:hypothetical protein